MIETFVLYVAEHLLNISFAFSGFYLISNALKNLFSFYITILAILAMLGHLSATSFAMAPLKIVPFGFPFSSFKITIALSSNFSLVPSGLLYSFLCLTIIAGTTCFLISFVAFTT